MITISKAASVKKNRKITRSNLIYVLYALIINTVLLRRYAPTPFSLIITYLYKNRITAKITIKTTITLIILFILIRNIRKKWRQYVGNSFFLAYTFTPWNRLAMLIDNIVYLPFQGQFLYTFMAAFISPVLPAGSLIWSTELPIPDKNILIQDLEQKTQALLEIDYLSINWHTLIGDIYSDLSYYLILYILVVSSLFAFSNKYSHKSTFFNILASYLFSTLMLTGRFNILMFPRTIWMLLLSLTIAVIKINTHKKTLSTQ